LEESGDKRQPLFLFTPELFLLSRGTPWLLPLLLSSSTSLLLSSSTSFLMS
jgi:hypothetical protein